jgi:hypothetical protein
MREEITAAAEAVVVSEVTVEEEAVAAGEVSGN